MNVFFEESGDFKVGTILSSAGEAHQVELASGKRSKVKAKDVLLQFASPEPTALMAQAEQTAGELDLDFLWEVAGEEEFGFAELGTEYFGHAPLPPEAAGLILGLHRAPMYFYKKGRGRYKAAPKANLQAALAGIEKKKQQALIQQQYVDELVAGRLPASMAPMALTLLFKPDKNSIEYKALDAACEQLHLNPARLMLQTGGIASAKALHLSKFLLEHFPKGTGFPAMKVPAPPADLPLAEVAAFSIDDVTTTEIDDAFSVVELPDGMLQVGIHIAAPGLGITRDDAYDVLARARMSTVYMPGDKITMLPDELVQAYTLGEGMTRPALSLYAIVNRADWSVVSTTTRAERVPMASNLRHNLLEDIITEEALNSGSGEGPNYPHKMEMQHLWQWAQVLEAGRMAKRAAFGLRPEQNNRVDFNFYVDDDVVTITRRKRGAPLDKIVAELMIFANSTWGKLMHDCGVPGIYRTQGTGWGGKLQVRMVTHAAPHQGLGVDQYAWSTSPLRRYTDLVNQWQILACVQKGVTAPLVAPFKPRDASLFALVSGFDAAYGAYADFQSNMERYWCLRWLGQQQARVVEAVVLKDEVVRLLEIPLVLKLPGLQQLARGTHLKLDIISWDEVELSVEARLAEVLQAEVLEPDEEESEGSDPGTATGEAEAAGDDAGNPAAGDDAGNPAAGDDAENPAAIQSLDPDAPQPQPDDAGTASAAV